MNQSLYVKESRLSMDKLVCRIHPTLPANTMNQAGIRSRFVLNICYSLPCASII